jgi:hypothetical protein
VRLRAHDRPDGELDAAFEARLAWSTGVGLGGQRIVDRIDREPHLHAAVLGDAAGRQAVR